MEQLKGTGVALITPFNEDGTIDYEGLSKVVNHVIEGGVDYLVALGTTAETATMSATERDAVLDHIKKINNGRTPLVVGIGGNNTKAVIEEIKRVDMKGVSAILSASPYYNKPTQEGIYQHYRCLAENSDLPLILYNVPGRTASNMLANTTIRLANDFENIVAIKEASGDILQVIDIVRGMPKDFMVISGEDGLNYPIIACGGIGVISVLANSQPSLCASVVKHSLNGNIETARSDHYRSIDFTNLLFAEGNPAGVKAAMALQGLCNKMVRLPLVEATESLSAKLKDAMKEL